MAPRIGINGIGGIGGVVGGMLARAGHDVTLVDQWTEHIDAIKREGLVVETTTAEYQTQPKALRISELQGVSEPFDLVFIAVKLYDTEWVAELMKGYAAPGAAFVVFQNGVSDEQVAAVVGRERTLGAVVLVGGFCTEPGRVVRTDARDGGFKIGELDGKDTPRAREIASIVNDVAGTEVTTNLIGERWSKLMINCMSNGVAGLTGYTSGEVRTVTGPRRVGIQLGAETVRVATKLGYRLDPVLGLEPQTIVDAAEGRNIEEVESTLIEMARGTGAGKPSLLQDVQKGRRTEIRQLNGYVAERGREARVPTPFSDRIVELFDELGIGFEPDPENLKPLEDMLP
jgi:2-dehydropantoate 2-reductase